MPALATLWPLRGSGSLDTLVVVVFVLVLLGAAPAGWVLLRRRFGADAAGPLWPILAFVVVAAGFALLTPPWQTSDEPQHMVHVEVVRRAGLSAPQQLLPGARPSPDVVAARAAADKEIVASMRETDATKWLPGATGALVNGVTPGPLEFSHPRLYYAVAAGVTAPLGGADILGRLAVLRALGIFFGAVTVWLCGAAGRLLWPGRRLAEAPMAIAVAVPTFVAFAGAVNNDGLAVLLGASLIVLLLAGVLERGWVARPLPWAVAIVVIMVLGVSTKRTFFPLGLLVLFAVAIRLRHRPVLVVAATAVPVFLVGVAFALSSSPRLALWEQQTAEISYRCRDGTTGEWAICLPAGAPSIRQKLPLVRAQDLKATPLVFSFTGHGTAPGQAVTVDFVTASGGFATRKVDVGIDARPLEVRTVAPADLDGLWVQISAPPSAARGTVVLRDVRLAPTDVGEAGAVTARNELQNGSGEAAVAGAPSFLPESVRRQVNAAVDAVDTLVHEPGALLDSVPLLWRRMATTFSMFWGTVGWQLPPPLFPDVVNWILAVVVALGIGGAAVALLRTRLPLFAGGLLLFGAAVMTVAVAFRNLPPDEPGVVNGRYLYPGLVAFVAVLAAGWGHLFPGPETDFRMGTRFLVPVMEGLYLALVFIPWLLK